MTDDTDIKTTAAADESGRIDGVAPPDGPGGEEFPPEPAGAEVDVFAAEDHILFIGRQQREYLCRLTPGSKIKLKGEYFDADRFIGLPVGTSIVTPWNLAYLALRPTLAERIMNMPREAQIIYPKDLALILYWADVRPGMGVVEVGTGHGAMTMSLIRAVGPSGRVLSIDIRRDHARRTRNNVKRYLGETPWWEIRITDARVKDFGEEAFGAAVIDMPSPWELADRAAAAVRPGGSAVVFLPTVPQVVQTVEAFRDTGKFAHFQTMEAMLRPWRIEGPSVRPEMRISGHTGFIIVTRRKLGQVVKIGRE